VTRALAGLAELVAVGAAVASWWPLALLAHVAAAWLAGRGLESGRRDERLLVVALVLALPVLGLVGLGAIRVWQRRAPPSGLYAGAHSEMAGLPGPGQAPEPVDRVFEWLQAQVSVQPVADLIRAAADSHCDVVMVDTAIKDGSTLFDALSSRELATLLALSSEIGPLLDASRPIKGWVDSASDGTQRFALTWTLLP